MKGVAITGLNGRGNQSGFLCIVKNYFVLPFGSGIWGFLSFMAIICLSKFLGNLVGTLEAFEIEFEDITLSLLGFIMSYLIKFLKNFSDS